MRFWVTGINGLVGSRLARVLLSRGHTVFGAGRGALRGQAPGADFRFQSVELASQAAVDAALDEAKPDVVLHTASMTEVDACEKNPQAAFEANVLAPTYVAQAATRVGAHLVHVSTDYVFDGDHGPYSEGDLPNPRGTYATTKHMGEQAVRVFAKDWAICRTAVVYGWPPSARPNFGSWMVGALEKREPIRLFEDQWVSPSWAGSVAEMLAEVGERKLPDVWNLCGAEVVDRVTYGRALCRVFGFDASLIQPSRMADLKLASPRPSKSGLKVDKARAQLKAQPLSLDEALRRFRAEYEQARSGT